jgi:ATP-dependent 26S proteasome regulatory subunit
MRPQVFKVAKALAPSVIYIDEVETVRALRGRAPPHAHPAAEAQRALPGHTMIVYPTIP